MAPGNWFNPNEEQMGSTNFGSANPVGIGLAMPQDITIDRDGSGRVCVLVVASS